MLVKVEKLKTAKIAGVKGQVSLGAYEVSAVDGQTIQLTGGYLKEGKSRMSLSIVLGVLFIIPIFITGDAARLPQGMIFDTFTGPDIDVKIASNGNNSLPVLDLSHSLGTMRAKVDLDSYLEEEKPKFFHIDIEVKDHKPQNFMIDRINDKEIKPIRLDVVERKDSDDLFSVRSKVKIKKLAKQFAKGINRFDVAFYEGDERISTEVILNLQF